MQINRKLTGGLAWGGLFLVLAIPSADLVSRQFGGDSSLLVTSEAPATEAKSPAAAAAGADKPTQVANVDPVKDYLSAGKKLPDYITGGDDTAAAPAAPAATPKPVAPQPVVTAKPTVTPGGEIVTSPPAVAGVPNTNPVAPPSTAPQTVAIAPEPLVAPVPMPAEMRPRPRPQAQPAYSTPPSAMTETPSTTTQAPLLIDEGPIVGDAEDDLIRPPESIRTVPAEDVLLPPANVGKDGEWDDEELAAYLEREGLIGTRLQRLRRDDLEDDVLYLNEEDDAEDNDSSVIFLDR